MEWKIIPSCIGFRIVFPLLPFWLEIYSAFITNYELEVFSFIRMFSKLLEALEWDKLHRLLHPDIFAWFMILGENIFFLTVKLKSLSKCMENMCQKFCESWNGQKINISPFRLLDAETFAWSVIWCVDTFRFHHEVFIRSVSVIVMIMCFLKFGKVQLYEKLLDPVSE